MKEITRINHVGLRVKSLDISRLFYEKLGFLFLVGPVGPEPVAIMEHPSGVNINFILNAEVGSTENILMDIPKKHTGYTHIALEVTDIDSASKEIERALKLFVFRNLIGWADQKSKLSQIPQKIT